MRAAVLHDPFDLRIEERGEPRPGPGDVLVEVALNGLCGTDATEYAKGPMMVPLRTRHPGSGHLGPTVLGHEFVGTVVDAGEQARDLVGRRVACGAGVSCGACRWCRAGRTNLCVSYYTLGLSADGGMAERAVSPASICVPIPPECADEDAALAQPLAVGIHAVRRSGLRPGQSVVLLGCGAIGSFVVAALHGHDGPVIGLDVDPGRLAAVEQLGATSTRLVPRDGGPVDLADLLPDGADVVFETSGAPGGAQRALALAARGGTVVLVGLDKAPTTLELAPVVLREVDVRTTVAHVCGTDMPQALALLAERPLAGLLVDRVVPLAAAAPDGLDALVHGRATGKILVDPRRG